MKKNAKLGNLWLYIYAIIFLIITIFFVHPELLVKNFWNSANIFQKVSLIGGAILLTGSIWIDNLKSKGPANPFVIWLLIIAIIFTIVSSFLMDPPLPKELEPLCAARYCL